MDVITGLSYLAGIFMAFSLTDNDHIKSTMRGSGSVRQPMSPSSSMVLPPPPPPPLPLSLRRQRGNRQWVVDENNKIKTFEKQREDTLRKFIRQHKKKREEKEEHERKRRRGIRALMMSGKKSNNYKHRQVADMSRVNRIIHSFQ